MKLAALPLLATVCAAQTAGSISGVARDAATGAPIVQVQVSSTLPGGKSIATSVDTQGHYTLTGLPAGTYRIRAEAPLEGQPAAPRDERTVKLEAGQSLNSIDFRLPSMGIVTGRVLDDKQQPVAGAQVFRVAKRYDHGAIEYPVGPGVFTDASGAYRLAGIPAGEEFVIEFRAKSLQSDAEGESPANTFYPDVLSPDLAAGIIVSPGETRAGVDIHLTKSPAYCVAGSVEAAPGEPLELSVLDALVSSQSRGLSRVGNSKPDGSFRVCGLHRGEYLLMASGREPAANQWPFFAAANLKITDRDIANLQLPSSSQTPISAEFVWDGDPPAQFPTAEGVHSFEGRSGGFNMGLKAPGRVAFSVPLPPDDYTIGLRDGLNGPGQYIKDITCGGRSVLHATFSLGGGASCGALRVVVAHDAGSLAALAADDAGNPVSGAYVAVVPQSAATEGEMSQSMTVGVTGADGVYNAAPLAPGKYRVIASYQMIDRAANRIAGLWAAQSRAQEIEVSANAGAQVTVKLQALH